MNNGKQHDNPGNLPVGKNRNTDGKRNGKDLETELFYMGLIFLTAAFLLWTVYELLLKERLPRIPCLMYTLLGIYCPGCGGTRAVRALLSGHVFLAFRYHPLIPYSAVITGGFMITQGLSRLGIKGIKGWKFHNWYLYGAVLIIIGNFLIKNLLLLVWNITI